MKESEQKTKTGAIARDARAQADGITGIVLTVVIVGIVALVGTLIVSSLVGGAIGPTGDSVSYEPTAGEEQLIDTQVDERPPLLEVRLTRENAIELQGEDADSTRSYIEFEQGGEVVTEGDGNWTLMASGKLDEGANGNATYNLLAVDNENVTVAFSDGEWVATYLTDDGSAQARLPAESPTTFTTLGVRYDGASDELTLTRNGVTKDTAALTATEPERPLQQDWYGTVDDYRFIDEAINDSELDRLADEPVAGSDADHAARYMLDEGEGSTSSAFYADADAEIVGGEWTAGLADPLAEDVDYEVSFNPLAVTTFGDGLADGSPILYVEYDTGLNAQVMVLVDGFGSAISLIPVLLITLVAGVIITVIGRIRS